MNSLQDPPDQGSLPKLTLPEGKELWQLGWQKSSWQEVDALLQPFDFGKFWVVNQAAERHLAEIRAQFDGSCGTKSTGRVLNRILSDDSDNWLLLQRVLALGVHPDLPKENSFRPSHDTADWKRPKCAKVLSLCRPSLTEKTNNGQTVLDIAKAKGGEEVVKVWEGVEKDGFPRVAKLAYLREWAVLQNLCRRRVIGEDEAKEKFDGKNAAEWARHYGELLLAKEIEYLLDLPHAGTLKIPTHFPKAKALLTDAQVRIDNLAEQLALAVENLSKANGEITQLREDLTSVNAALQKKDEKMDKMKEEISEIKKSSGDKITKLESELSQLKDANAAIKSSVASLVEKSISQLRDECFLIKGEISRLKGDQDSVKGAVAVLSASSDDLARGLNELQIIFDFSRNEVDDEKTLQAAK